MTTKERTGLGWEDEAGWAKAREEFFFFNLKIFAREKESVERKC